MMGVIFGLGCGYFLCLLKDISFRDGNYGNMIRIPSTGNLTVGLFAVMGGLIGFGVGCAKLVDHTYLK